MSIKEILIKSNSGNFFGSFQAQISEIQKRETRDGKPYYDLEFVDFEEKINLKVWESTSVFQEISFYQVKEFVEVKGEFGKNQYGINGRNLQIRRLSEEERKEFLHSGGGSQKEVELAFQFIQERVETLKDPRYRRLANEFLKKYGEAFCRAAAGFKLHHAFRGGLVLHVAQMLRSAEKIFELYPQLNRDLLLTGVIFHDCGKIVESCPTSENLVIPRTIAGEMLGHIQIGIEIVNRLWREAELDSIKNLRPSNEQARIHLLHLISSHHGTKEHGSPVLPKTPEAIVLHYLDNLDAKLEMLADFYAEKKLEFEGIYEHFHPLDTRPIEPLERFRSFPKEIPHVIELLEGMVREDTTNGRISGRLGSEVALMEELAEFAQAQGLETHFFEVTEGGYDSKNLLITSGGNLIEGWLLLESHLDTVSAGGMGKKAFSATVEDGDLIGRGACDTKGSGAAMLWALIEAKKQGILKKPVGVLFSVDEEVGKAGIDSFCKLIQRGKIPKPGLAVVGEPTNFQVVVAHNGALRLRIRAHGVAAHSSSPERGQSAIWAMAQFLNVLERKYIARLGAEDKWTGKAKCCVTKIEGGVQVNVVPAECEVWVDRRLLPCETREQVEAELRGFVADFCEKMELRVEVVEVVYDPPMRMSLTGEKRKVLQKAFQSVNLLMVEVGAPYGTNAANLVEAGVESVVLGPGEIQFAHTDKERIQLKDVEKAVELYLEIIRGFAG